MNEYQFMYRCRFASFVDFAFRELYPDEFFKDNWHIRLAANLLQFTWLCDAPEVVRRQIFNLPPGYLKTLICSIAFPAWILGRDPRKEVLIVSETPEMAMDIQERCVELMSSRRYRMIFPRVKIKRSSRGVELTYGGAIRYGGVGYNLPHRKSDLVVIDNPQSLHTLDRFKPESWLELSRLLKEPKKGVIIINTRRLADNDVSSFLYNSCHGWGCMAFPAIGVRSKEWLFPPDDHHVQRRGEPLHPAHEDWEELEKHLAELGGEAFAFQYLQGQYKPQTIGQREGIDEHGKKFTMVGTFDPTWTARDDLGKMKEAYYAGFVDRSSFPKLPMRPGSA